MEFFRNDGARTGLYFGATSGVITTIGLIAGLNAGTNSVAAVLGGILVIAVADSLSDALGIHLAEEADPEFLLDLAEVHLGAGVVDLRACRRSGQRQGAEYRNDASRCFKPRFSKPKCSRPKRSKH